MTETPETPERDVVVWPGPRDDLDEEPSHRAARIADRDRGLELGDFDSDLERADDGADP